MSTQHEDINNEDETIQNEIAERIFNKQQEVMKNLFLMMENSDIVKNLKKYSLYKNSDYFGFGIAFHTEDINISESYHKLVYPLVEIDANSPAFTAGMKNGQRVVAVNGDFVNKNLNTLEEIVQAIEESYYNRDFTDITVLDSNLWNNFMDNPRFADEFSKKQTQKESDENLPRLCRLSRNSKFDQYGFDFKTLKNECKHVVSNIYPGSPADKAGLRNGDCIIEINGESITDLDHHLLAKIIIAHPTKVDFLVVSDLNSYIANKQPDNKKISRHEVKLIQGFNGIGIGLAANGLINSIEPNSPADKAGLRKDFKIVEVNGINVEDNSNKIIANLIKTNENNLIIGVSNSVASMPIQSDNQDDERGSRVCNLIQRADFKGFGFTMRSNINNPIQISYVEEDSPAHVAGLKIDDFVLKVNDTNVASEHYNKTITLIKSEAEKGRMKLEVIEPHLYSNLNQNNKKSSDFSTIRTNFSNGSKITATSYSEIRSNNLVSINNRSVTNLPYSVTNKPKFMNFNIKLIPEFKGYGFTLTSKIKPKHVIYSVDPKSPAYTANLRENDVIVEINGKNIRRLKLNKVKQLLVQSQYNGQVEILAIDKKGYLYYKDRKKKFCSKKLVASIKKEPLATFNENNESNNAKFGSENNLPDREIEPSAPIFESMPDNLENFEIINCTVYRENDKPLGLYLSKPKQKGQLEELFPLIKNVDQDSAAELAGLKAGDVIIEVNGSPTNGKSNNTVVEWISSSGNKIDFLISREKPKKSKNSTEDQIKKKSKIIAEEAKIIADAKLKNINAVRRDSFVFVYSSKEKIFDRQQEVMENLVLMMDNPDIVKNLKKYSLYKNSDYFGFGIAFHTEDINISEPYHKLVYPLVEIDANSPAFTAGMKNGQRVVAVNGDFVNKNLNALEEIVQAIEESYYNRDFTDITVLDSNLWEEFMNNPKLKVEIEQKEKLSKETSAIDDINLSKTFDDSNSSNKNIDDDSNLGGELTISIPERIPSKKYRIKSQSNSIEPCSVLYKLNLDNLNFDLISNII